jgi:PAS domain S-box-containing protein
MPARESSQTGQTPGKSSVFEGDSRDIGALLVESSPDALIAVSADSAVLFWSTGAEGIFGYKKEEALGRSLQDLIVPPELVQESRKAVAEAVESGSTVFESIRRRKDGSVIYVDITAKAVRDGRDRLKFVAISQKDVTQLKIRSHGRALAARYHGLLETVPDAILMINNTGRIVLVNGQAEALFGYQREELLGLPIEMLLPERFRHIHMGHRTHYLGEPKTRPMGAGLDLYARRKDATEFPVEISLSPLQTEEDLFVMSAIRDITDQKKLEEQLFRKNEELEQQNHRVREANRLKSEFLANMSHELRTPLNGIIGFAEIMHDAKVGPVSAEHKEYLGDILTSARHLLQLINDILDLSKVEAGKMEFSPGPLDPKTVVAEVSDIVRALAAKKRIRLRSEIDPALGDIVADPRSLKQILYNYLSNAIKFTPEDGQIVVRVAAEGASHFRVEVEDTGVGIQPHDMARLFAEFRQLASGPGKEHPGTGLGLALTKKIVEAQGGRVGANSTALRGSTFYAVLPRVLRASGEKVGEEKTRAAAPPEALSILVVEDDARDRDYLVRTLGEAGYAVETAVTGAEAMSLSADKRFDAITLDLLLPDMSGRDVLRQVRAGGPNQQTPVVVVTVLAHKGVVAGFHVADILPKPIPADDLLKALKRCGVDPDIARPILVVDDDPSALKLADTTLRHLGYHPLCQQDAKLALELASRERPAAIVLDLVMPEISGFEFLTEFRKTEQGHQIPVIVWTGKDLTAEERQILRSEAASIVGKNAVVGDLIRELETCLGRPEPPPGP